MTRISLAAALALATGFAAPAAFAHAYPKTSVPAPNSTVQSPPAEVAIEFDDELEPKFTTMTVQDAKGARVSDGPAHVAADDAKHLSVALKPLAPGKYNVVWHATDTDTHKTQGSFSFTVQP